MSSNRQFQGVVSEFDSTRGCGTIQSENGERLTVRYSAIQGNGLRQLNPGDRVAFEVEQGHRGPNAVRVVRC